VAVDDNESNQKLKQCDLRPFRKMQKRRQVSALETHQPVSTISPAKSRHEGHTPFEFDAKQPINIFVAYPQRKWRRDVVKLATYPPAWRRVDDEASQQGMSEREGS